MFGVKTEKNDQDEYDIKSGVKYVLQTKAKIYCHQEVKGPTKTAAERFINGTNFVTKHSVS